MATIDITRRQIAARIVYYGPSLSGKTTNLLNIRSRLPEGSRGEMRSIATEAERTLFFDFVPIAPLELGGWNIRFHLYSVPGQDDYVRTRRALLSGADGVVFVADASPDRQAANAASLIELADHLEHYGKSIETVPLVVQANKVDLPGAVSADQVLALLPDIEPPVVEAIAIQGNGVAETLALITQQVARTL